MNQSANPPERPASHQRIIALMQSAAPPPADDETPALPDELLRRLQEKFGSTSEQPRHTSLWTRFRESPNTKYLALAACLLLVGIITSRTVQENGTETITWRGNHEQPKELPSYWLNTDNATPAIKGLGLPNFKSVSAAADLPDAGLIKVFDPKRSEIHLVRDGKSIASVTVEDSSDPESWDAAHRQLLKLLKP